MVLLRIRPSSRQRKEAGIVQRLSMCSDCGQPRDPQVDFCTPCGVPLPSAAGIADSKALGWDRHSGKPARPAKIADSSLRWYYSPPYSAGTSGLIHSWTAWPLLGFHWPQGVTVQPEPRAAIGVSQGRLCPRSTPGDYFWYNGNSFASALITPVRYTRSTKAKPTC